MRIFSYTSSTARIRKDSDGESRQRLPPSIRHTDKGVPYLMLEAIDQSDRRFNVSLTPEETKDVVRLIFKSAANGMHALREEIHDTAAIARAEGRS